MVPHMGVVLDINEIVEALYALPFNVELGMVVYLPEQFDSVWNVHAYPPDQPHLFRYGNNIDELAVMLGLGVELVREVLYAGGGVQVMPLADGIFYAERVAPGPEAPSQNPVLQGDLNIQIRFLPTAGVLIRPAGSRLRIGLAYRQGGYLDVDPLAVIAQIEVGGLTVDYPLFITIVSNFLPDEYSAALAFELGPFLVSLEATRQVWSDYRFSTSETIHYYPGNPDLSGYVGGEPDFRDTLNLSLGLACRLNDSLSLLAGYCHQPTPVPDQSGRVSNYLDADRHIFSLGLRYALHRFPVTLEAMAQYHRLRETTVLKEGVRGKSWIEQESYRLEGEVLCGGVGLSLRW